MSRSLRLNPQSIDRVKLALKRNGFPSQRALAEEVGLSLATVNNFLTGKPVDFATFEELSRQLALDWKEIADFDFEPTPRKTSKALDNLEIPETDPENSPPYPSGPVPLGSPFYLERVPIEARIKQEIKKPGALVRIKAPGEMGKTSLLLRVLEFAKTQNYHTVSLNLDRADQAILKDLNQFLRWLCANTARQLQIKPGLDEYWDEDLGSKISCTLYFEDYLLKSIRAPILLALDEVHQIFERPAIAKDFLSLLRSWYEEGKNSPIWQKLRIIIVYSTEIYVPLQLNQSPFNVGLPIELNHFREEEIGTLARRYGLDWEKGEYPGQLMSMVGGHPVLVQIALYHLSRGEITLERLLESAPTNFGIYTHHLRRHWLSLKEDPELLATFHSVLQGVESVSLEPIFAHKLTSMGLIKRLETKIFPTCELYQQFFSRKQISFQ